MPRGIGLTRMSSNSLLLERMASDLSEGHVDDDEAFLVLTRMIGYAAAAAAARGMMRWGHTMPVWIPAELDAELHLPTTVTPVGPPLPLQACCSGVKPSLTRVDRCHSRGHPPPHAVLLPIS